MKYKKALIYILLKSWVEIPIGFILFTICFSILIVNCGSKSANCLAADDYNERTKVHQSFEVVLNANFGTGYRWELLDSCKQFFEILDYTSGSNTKSESHTDYQKWSLKAIRMGCPTLKFVLRRPWDEDEDISELKKHNHKILISKK